MNEYIAYCGLDCEACEARLATVNNDNELRAKTAEEWSKLNGVPIAPKHINCQGCKTRQSAEARNLYSVSVRREHHAGRDRGKDAGRNGILLCPGRPESDLVGPPRRRNRRSGNLE